jgi:hypothetical protein
VLFTGQVLSAAATGAFSTQDYCHLAQRDSGDDDGAVGRSCSMTLLMKPEVDVYAAELAFGFEGGIWR